MNRIASILTALLMFAGALAGFSSCASRALSPRGQANLDRWEEDTVYDPVTKRRYHTQTPPTAQEALYEDSTRELTGD